MPGSKRCKALACTPQLPRAMITKPHVLTLGWMPRSLPLGDHVGAGVPDAASPLGCRVLYSALAYPLLHPLDVGSLCILPEPLLTHPLGELQGSLFISPESCCGFLSKSYLVLSASRWSPCCCILSKGCKALFHLFLT